jgi:phosphate transport system substrate-binding protein
LGLGGKGNEAVAGQVKQLKNAIGYVELIYAVQSKMTYAKVKNQAGAFVEPSLASVTAAAGSMKEMPADFRVSITDAPGKEAYPISTFTWLLIPEKIPDAAKKKTVVEFLHWMLTTGQTQTAALDYAPLPKVVVAKEEKAIAKIQ